MEKREERMHRHLRYLPFFIIGFAAFFASCAGPGKGKYLYVTSGGGVMGMEVRKSGVIVRFEPSKNSLVDNVLTVVNSSSKPVRITPFDVIVKIQGTKLWAPAVPDFDRQITRRSARLDSMCRDSRFPYACSDEIREFYRSLLGKGFPFGTVAPGDSASGFVAFDIPLVISRSKWDHTAITEKSTVATSYRSQLRITFAIGNKKTVITLPLTATVYNNLESVPYAVVKYLL
jgi:hypothetical protein